MRVEVIQYKWAGSWGPFRIRTRCGECSLTEGIIRDLLASEFRELPVAFQVTPWLDNWWRVIGRGGWHAPIVTVNGRVVQQGKAVDRGLLGYHIRRALVSGYEPRGNVVFYREGCPYCGRAKQALDQDGVPYLERDVIADPLATLQLIRAAKRVLPRNQPVTVPQVWLDGAYFGDSEAVLRAHRAGELTRYARAV